MPTAVSEEPTTSRSPRRPWRRKRVALLAATAGLIVLAPLGAQVVTGGLPQFGDLFEQEIVDRSPAPLLLELRDVAEYRAATGTFQVLVDLERDTPNVPSIISGERTTFFGTENVDAVVDFSALGPEQVSVSADRRSVAVALPAPTLTEAVLDPEQSRVVGRERGIVERVGGVFDDLPADQQELYALAASKLDIAAQQSDLADRAEQNTRDMLTALAGSLGYEQVTVTFGAADRR